jgi:hypothetical protein
MRRHSEDENLDRSQHGGRDLGERQQQDIERQ